VRGSERTLLSLLTPTIAWVSSREEENSEGTVWAEGCLLTEWWREASVEIWEHMSAEKRPARYMKRSNDVVLTWRPKVAIGKSLLLSTFGRAGLRLQLAFSRRKV
jgi:hypothetical protein